jgi:hypothetical protein
MVVHVLIPATWEIEAGEFLSRQKLESLSEKQVKAKELVVWIKQ